MTIENLSPDDLQKLAKLLLKDAQFAKVIVDELERRGGGPQWLTEDEASAVCGLKVRSLQEMRYQGSGPPFVKLGDSKKAPIRYPAAELHLWVNTRQRFRSTREALNDGVDEYAREP